MNIVTNLLIAQQCKRKISSLESLIELANQQIARLKQGNADSRQVAQIKRLEKEIDDHKHKINQIKRTGNPY